MIPCTHYKGKPLLIKLLLLFFVPNPVPFVTRIIRWTFLLSFFALGVYSTAGNDLDAIGVYSVRYGHSPPPNIIRY